ncbi:ras-related protein Rab-18 [Lucilia cuprina]|uniref:ras-related protein Rab-18 n=1 Tax=Lucilia cuprina TaxID=7375 RepID=UPI001F05A699|nr:ras-related protein Rab-18 [Lucilia cuprina]
MLSDKAIKLLVIGESGVGKSSLIRRFVENKFDENHDVTIGMDFKSKVMNIDGVDYKLALWDTAGAERFRSLTPSFYRKALGAILVYDITNRESLVKLEAWFTELENYSDNPNIATIVVGNKIDNERVISREEGLKFARKHRSLFLETSAKHDKFVADVFRDIVEKVSSRRAKSSRFL